MKTLSKASSRAQNYPCNSPEWYCGFSYTSVTGIGPEEGIHRRDPSSIIEVDGILYVFYTRSSGPHFGRSQIGNSASKLFPWDYADIYYSTSKDGINWKEQGIAVSRGESGSFDSRTVCTPDVLAHEGKYYLVYQTQTEQETYTGRSESVGMALADSPNGPWEKVHQTILTPMEDGEWFGDNATNYNSGMFRGVTHDPSLYFYKNAWWLYYKCGYGYEGIVSEGGHKYAGPDTRWGVAISNKPEGPYRHSDLNPITNSGLETMLWHYNDGIAALLNRDGPEQDTIQWASDGLNFEIMSHVHNTPQAPGAYRAEISYQHPLDGVRWGLCHIDERGALWNHIVRFDTDPRFSYKFGLGYASTNTASIF